MATSNTPDHSENVFDNINLKSETYVLPAGRYKARIANVRLLESRNADTLWLFITLDIHDVDGVVMIQVEDPFITIAAREGSPQIARVREGLKRLALYSAATAVEFHDVEPEDIGGMLIGQPLTAVISCYGTGVAAKNRVTTVVRSAV